MTQTRERSSMDKFGNHVLAVSTQTPHFSRVSMTFSDFSNKWAETGASERANFQPVCDGLVAVLRELHDELDAGVRTVIQQTGWTSEQDIKLVAQHFKGVRAPKVQAIADALITLGQAA